MVDGGSKCVNKRGRPSGPPSLVTSLNPYIGYERAAKVQKEMLASGRSIRDIVLSEGLMTDAELDKALDTMALTKGGIAK